MASLINSNDTGLSFAEEVSLKVLPTTPTFFALEPNTYADFGGKYSTVAREVINSSRQRLKGSLTDLDASMGFNSDLTQRNLQRIMQGFFFAKMREKKNTQPMNGAIVTLTSITPTTINAASGLTGFISGTIAQVQGSLSSNNNAFVLSAATDTVLTTSGLTADASPSASARVEAVGFQFVAGDATISMIAGKPVLNSTTQDMTLFGLTVGEWIFIGGDTTASNFAAVVGSTTQLANQGYARVASVSAHQITFDITTFGAVAVADAGTGKTLQIFFGKLLRNELDPTLIVRTSYTLERTLGNDGVGLQSELVVGAIANELTLNLTNASKVTCDLSFVGMDSIRRNGTVGLLAGTRIASLGEGALNTSRSVYQSRVYVQDSTTSLPTALYGFAEDIKMTVKNNVKPNKAIGTLGSIEATAGEFEVDSTLTVYFSTVAAVDAIRNNSSCGLYTIFAAANAGIIVDNPLVTLGGGLSKVEKDKKIMVDLTAGSAMNPAGYTLLINFFPYLPNAAMPV